MTKSKLLLISMIIVLLYLVANGFELLRFINSDDPIAQISGYIAGFLVGPHFLLVVLGFIFNSLGFFQSHKNFALTGGILYASSIVFFLPNIFILIFPTTLNFIAYANMDKQQISRRDLSIYQSHHYKTEVDEKNYQEAKQYFASQRKKNVYRSNMFSTQDYAMNRTLKSMFKGAQYLFGALVVFYSLGQIIDTSRMLLGIMLGISMFPLTFDLIAEYRYKHRDDLIKYEVIYFFLVIIIIANLY